jgi:hypothetical protein
VIADRPWVSQGGRPLGKIELKADLPAGTPVELTVPLPDLSELTGKHAIFFKFLSETKDQSICSLENFVFQ